MNLRSLEYFLVAADELTGEITRVTEGTSFVVDGTTYKYTFGMTDTLEAGNVDNNVVAYLDAYGYVIYIDESAMTYDYAYVLDVGSTGSKYNGDDAFGATLLLTDGTVVEVDLDVPSSVDTEDNGIDIDDVKAAYEFFIVSYTVDDDEYTLNAMEQADDKKADEDIKRLSIENDRSRMTIGEDEGEDNNVYANSNTVFLIDDGDDNYTVYTGVANVPDITYKDTDTYATYYCASGNVARVVYILNANVEGDSSVAFVEADPDADRVRDTVDGDYYELNAVIDGELTTIRVAHNSDAWEKLIDNVSETTIMALDRITYDSDNQVTDVREFSSTNVSDSTPDGQDTVTGTREYERDDDTVGLGYTGTEYFTYSDDAVVAYYDGDEFRTSRITSIGDDENDTVIAVFDDGQIIGLCVIENDGEKKPEVTDYDVVSFNDNPMEVTADTTGITLKYAKVVDSNGDDYDYGTATLTAKIQLREGNELIDLDTVSEEVTATTQKHVLADSTGVTLESSMLRDGDWISVTLTLSNKEMGTITFVENEQFRISAPAEGGAGT